MTIEDYKFYVQLKHKLQEAILNHSLVVSSSLSAGGITKTVSFESEEKLHAELNRVEAVIRSFTGGSGGGIKYPVWRSC